VTHYAYPFISTGTKLGLHSLSPNQIIPLVRQAQEQGLVWPLVKSVDNAGVCIDAKRISEGKTLTIFRYVNPAYDSVQGIELLIDQGARDRGIADSQAILAQINDRLRTTEEKVSVNWVEPLNEADPPPTEAEREVWNRPENVAARNAVGDFRHDPPAIIGWRNFGLYLREIAVAATASGYKLALPAFNAGTPEYEEMVAFVGTGLFSLLKQGGHILSLHEGVFGNGPVNTGYGDVIPSAPIVPGAGSLCFRLEYLYSLLRARDEVVPVVISEFYAGGGYEPVQDAVSVLARFRWYDTLARQRYPILAFTPFTIDPLNGWGEQNYTYVYQSPLLWEYLNEIKTHANASPTEAPPTPVPGPSWVGKVVEVTGNLNLRRGPGTNHSILTTLYPGTRFTVQEQSGNWMRTTTTGWCYNSYLRIVQTPVEITSEIPNMPLVVRTGDKPIGILNKLLRLGERGSQ